MAVEFVYVNAPPPTVVCVAVPTVGFVNFVTVHVTGQLSLSRTLNESGVPLFIRY